MIVETSFLDHWKIKMLIALTGDPAAPMMLLRLWAHCQERKRWVFNDMSDYALKAICGWGGEPERLKPILEECGWLDKHPSDVIVHEWEIYNASLIQSWTVGRLGGRPRKNRADNPEETAQKPGDNPPVMPGLFKIEGDSGQNGGSQSGETQPEPGGNPDETRGFTGDDEKTRMKPGDNPPVSGGIPGGEPGHNPDITRSEPIREEKIREDKKNTDGVRLSGQQISAQAELVYQAYPRKVGKPSALKAIEKALRSLSFEELRNLTREYARAVEGAEPQFIPHPATWFNDARYQDDPSTWSVGAKKDAPAINPNTGF
jgi:hypothetical protein